MKGPMVVVCIAVVVLAAQAQVSIDWREGASLPLGGQCAASGLIDGRIYMFGGFIVPSVVHWAYDVAGDSWETELAPMPNPSTEARGVVYNGELYVLGGYWPLNAVMRKYNPALDTWFILSSPPLRTTVYANGAAAVGDRIYYYFGRWNDSTYSNELWEYDPAQDFWFEHTPAQAPPRWFPGSASNGDYCYAVGGSCGAQLWSDFFRYHAPSGRWDTLPDYPVGVYDTDGDFLRDRLFIAGGGCSFDGFPELREVFYWTEAGGWDSTDFLPEKVGNPHVELTTLNDTDYIFVFGGTRDRVSLNTMYVGVITGLQGAVTEDRAVPARDHALSATVVRGVLRIGDRRQGTGDRAELLDINCRKVMDLRLGVNDVRHLSPGVYFVRPTSSVMREASSVTRVVVTR